MNSRIPAYPLFTIDPLFSIWSRTDALSGFPVSNWDGTQKSITGTIGFNGNEFRFLGCGGSAPEQLSFNNDFLTSQYVFGNRLMKLAVSFWSPFVPDDMRLLSCPIAVMEYSAEIFDGAEGWIELKCGNDVCFHNKNRRVGKSDLGRASGFATVCVKNLEVEPLSYSADGVSADWGAVYLSGENAYISDDGISVKCKLGPDGKASGYFLLAYDDGYSIEYFGRKLKGLWREFFPDMESALSWFHQNFAKIKNAKNAFESRMNADCVRFCAEYAKVLKTACRQVFAAHKAVRADNGELLYLSKECHSNGCVGTTDVSYPSMPFFLKYSPALAAGMLNGIFTFAESNKWVYRFAPHDLGRYPLANGQVYGLLPLSCKLMMKYGGKPLAAVLKYGYVGRYMMPVEECGNMLIMTYACCFRSKDCELAKKHYSVLKQWADYLVNQGVILGRQLCTDDFAGHSKANVNLAVKSCVAIACFGRLSKLCGKDGETYAGIAKSFAEKLTAAAAQDGRMNFSVGAKDTWSLKYNMVWDKIFGLGLFNESEYAGESRIYREMAVRYGVPLDHRNRCVKSDWLLWAAALDATGKNTIIFARMLCAFLEDTPDRTCFPDYYDGTTAKDKGMNHRSVQGGLWMPLLADGGESE